VGRGALHGDASPRATGFHIVGSEYAKYFLEGSFFDDVMLVMDCCRDDGPRCRPMA